MKTFPLILLFIFSFAVPANAASYDGIYDFSLADYAGSKIYLNTEGSSLKLVLLGANWAITLDDDILFIGNLGNFLNDGIWFFLNGQKLGNVRGGKEGRIFNGDLLVLKKIGSLDIGVIENH